jgi:hypothetical protein
MESISFFLFRIALCRSMAVRRRRPRPQPMRTGLVMCLLKLGWPKMANCADAVSHHLGHGHLYPDDFTTTHDQLS